MAKSLGLDVNSEEFKKHLETFKSHDHTKDEHVEEQPAGSENWNDAQWKEHYDK